VGVSISLSAHAISRNVGTVWIEGGIDSESAGVVAEPVVSSELRVVE
jgi:hypothetical protein